MQLALEFPLTLTLSPEERESLSAILEYSHDRELFPAPPDGLPLLWGEGRGEGERVFQMNRYG